jgi:hypothetical protein
LYFFRGGTGEASSAGYGREALKMPVYMPWPQSGRMQYEKIKKKNQKKNLRLRQISIRHDVVLQTDRTMTHSISVSCPAGNILVATAFKSGHDVMENKNLFRSG